MTRKLGFVCFLAIVLAVIGCSKKESTEQADAGETTDTSGTVEPQYITVQHILIGFEGSVPGKPITRSPEEAQKLAEDLLKKAQAGEDFDALVKEYTDDSHPGVYKMANFGAPADMSQRVFARDGMVKAFGDVGFPLEVGGVGLAAYDDKNSPFGWHIIKRVE
jgi:hypothetical protein